MSNAQVYPYYEVTDEDIEFLQPQITLNLSGKIYITAVITSVNLNEEEPSQLKVLIGTNNQIVNVQHEGIIYQPGYQPAGWNIEVLPKVGTSDYLLYVTDTREGRIMIANEEGKLYNYWGRRVPFDLDLIVQTVLEYQGDLLARYNKPAIIRDSKGGIA